MTLRQKAAQVLLLGFEGTTLTSDTRLLLADSPPGGFLILARNVTGAAQLRALTAALQVAAAAAGPAAGLLLAVDQEGGAVQRVRDGVPTVPAARELGDDSTPAEAARLAAETADALLKLGVNMNLAPVADVVVERESFLYERTYSGDSKRVAAFVAGVTEAYSRAALITAVKHFPGHGSAAGDTHGQAVISETTRADFESIHLPPFRAAFAAGAEAVMMAHIIATAYDPDRPASLSNSVIEGLLRADLAFEGVVISDDLEMAAALDGSRAGTASVDTAGLGEASVSALEAGCDLLISTGPLARQRAMVDAIAGAAATGRLSLDRLDQAVLRVLELKLRHGIVAQGDAP